MPFLTNTLFFDDFNFLYSAARKARSSLMKLKNKVDDQLSLLAFKQLLDIDYESNFNNARELLKDSR